MDPSTVRPNECRMPLKATLMESSMLLKVSVEVLSIE